MKVILGDKMSIDTLIANAAKEGHSSRQLMTWIEVRTIQKPLEASGWGIIQVENGTTDLRGEYVDRVTIFDTSRFRRFCLERGSGRTIPANAIYIDKDNHLGGQEIYLIPI